VEYNEAGSESQPEETDVDDLDKAVMAVRQNARWAIQSGASLDHLLGAIDDAWEQEVCHCDANEQDPPSKHSEP
jgi:hypothetical protein